MILGKTKKMLEQKRNEFVLDLSNNYKERAYGAWKGYEALIMDLKKEGKLNDKDYQKLIDDVNSFKRVFEKIHS